MSDRKNRQINKFSKVLENVINPWILETESLYSFHSFLVLQFFFVLFFLHIIILFILTIILPIAILYPLVALKSGRTALHEAAKEGHAEVCRYLLKQGAHVNATDNVSGSQIEISIIENLLFEFMNIFYLDCRTSIPVFLTLYYHLHSLLWSICVEYLIPLHSTVLHHAVLNFTRTLYFILPHCFILHYVTPSYLSEDKYLWEPCFTPSYCRLVTQHTTTPRGGDMQMLVKCLWGKEQMWPLAIM